MHSSQSSIYSGLTSVYGEAGALRQMLHASTAVGLSPAVQHLQRFIEPDGLCDSGDQGGSSLVARQSQHQERGPLEQFVPDLQLFTDASQMAWGAHLNEWQVSRLWSQVDLGLHINVLELKAVRYAYEMWYSHYGPGTKWLVFLDNTTVVAHINKQGGTRSRPFCLEAERLCRLCWKNGHILRARHIPGKRNVWADQLSRPTLVLGTSGAYVLRFS